MTNDEARVRSIGSPTEQNAPLSQPLQELLDMIQLEVPTPAIGVQASKAVSNCFESTARDVIALAQDNLDRANEIMQQALSFATIIRESGNVLCGRIEQETATGFQVSTLIRAARERLAGRLPDAPEVQKRA